MSLLVVKYLCLEFAESIASSIELQIKNIFHFTHYMLSSYILKDIWKFRTFIVTFFEKWLNAKRLFKGVSLEYPYIQEYVRL